MGELVIVVNSDSFASDSGSREKSLFGGGSFRVHNVCDEIPAGDDVEGQKPPQEMEANPMDAWLPITESRNGTVLSVVFHLVCSGLGFQALLLPFAFATLGWAWGVTILSVAFIWQFYTIWLLVNLHESESQSGARYSRYVHLSIVAFGEKLGKVVAIFPVMYLSGGTCAMMIITGGGAMKLFFNTIFSDGGGPTVNTVVWFLVFMCMSILLAQIIPNLNSVARVSLIGSLTAVVYCTLIWALPMTKDRPTDVSRLPLAVNVTGMKKFGDILNAIGIIVLSFRGHNLILEIQATLPSSSKQKSHKAMWRGVQISYLLISLCLFPIAFAGFWAYGNQIPANGMLKALSKFHGQNISKFVMGLIYFLIIVNSISTFQVYSIVVFDNLESKYAAKKKQRCPRLLKVVIRFLFGGLVYFVAVAFPFLGSLAPLVGGLTMPLTFVYPCFMWISIKKPRRCSAMWLINAIIGCLGVILGLLLVIAALWNLADKGLKANFFKP